LQPFALTTSVRLVPPQVLQDPQDPSYLLSAQRKKNFFIFACSTNPRISVYVVILSNRLAQTIPAQVPPALTEAGLPASSVASFLTALTSGSAAAFEAVQGLTPAIQAIGARAYQNANADAYKTVYLSTLAFSGVGIILTFFSPIVDHLLNGDVTIQLVSSYRAL
jgi:hypothetical protein